MFRAVVGFVFWFATTSVFGQTLENELQQSAPGSLAAESKLHGDARRGAIVFFQPYLACSKCHLREGEASPLGPDLVKLGKEVDDTRLVEALLSPSKTIRQGFETLTITTSAGQRITGLLAEERDDVVKLRDATRIGETVSVAKKDIDERAVSPISLMPNGQVNQLASRQQFLDLVRYLIEIRDGGGRRALELQPDPALYAAPPLPEYEQQLDHAGLIGAWNGESLQRGEAIYRRVCANCHGTHEQPGSLPTAPRFGEAKLKNGSDPWAMYQTLTRGFGLMVPQAWMVPEQKYDVIHYIREAYFKPRNANQFVPTDAKYLARLPKGTTRGPAPAKFEPWVAMDYGPFLTHTYEFPTKKSAAPNFAYKGIAIRLDAGPGGVSRGERWMIFDHDTLRVAGAWGRTASNNEKKSQEAFIDWRGIQFDGQHGIHPRVVGTTAFTNPVSPGWANPQTGEWTDPRLVGRDQRRYGPLPRDWAKFRGLYQHGMNVVLSYKVGDTEVLELPGLSQQPVVVTAESTPTITSPAITRTFNIGPRSRDLVLQVATGDFQLDESKGIVSELRDSGKGELASIVGVSPLSTPAGWLMSDQQLRLKIPAGATNLRFTVWLTKSAGDNGPPKQLPTIDNATRDLAALMKGGPTRWPQKLTTRPRLGEARGPFAVDLLTHPTDNPWLAQMRLTGFDFFDDGDRLAICSWDGDVWLVSGLKTLSNTKGPELQWQRIASGLFQPLGLKIVAGKIFVTCRDQLVQLHDYNGDGETDFYECFNNDHQVTEHFHEFAMGLQTDDAGNFYYAKSARHALTALVPHHGTLLRVSRDGSRTDILANGFRAANGVCLNPDGTFIVTDQEGHWNPKNRINWVTVDPNGPPRFYGNMFGYHDVTDAADSAMEPPLCWITNAFDRSPAELLWVPKDRWVPLSGALLNLSYGYGKIFVVPQETIDGVRQGGMIALPVPALPTGIMRGRFHPGDGQLYTCGMFSWAGSATAPGGFYRIRYTGQPAHLPTKLHATTTGLTLTFTDPLDPASVSNVENFAIQSWSLKRTANYGSKHFDERPLKISAATLSADGRTVNLTLPEIQPTWCMEIKYSLRTASQITIDGTLHNTIHRLGKE